MNLSNWPFAVITAVPHARHKVGQAVSLVLMARHRLELPFAFVLNPAARLWSDRLDVPVVHAGALRGAAESRL
ncbi:hypothetical protein [Streptomyces sp. 1222.5]|uniref:hypothetical protein n=1 Tax=Streptomyces sp. 1222.5 TaxID=1881026 RepID=UPI003D7433AB